ncbi:MAG: hypothetical protein ACOVOI_08905, partial [Hyphomicrobiales bacterium]
MTAVAAVLLPLASITLPARADTATLDSACAFGEATARVRACTQMLDGTKDQAMKVLLHYRRGLAHTLTGDNEKAIED